MEKTELEQTLKQRVIKVVEMEYGTSVNKFAAALGLRQTTLNDQINGNSKISATVILAILSVHPNISAEWLLRGKGEMYSIDGTETSDYVIRNLFAQLATKDTQIAEKDKQLAAAQAENAKLLDLAKVKITHSTLNDVKL